MGEKQAFNVNGQQIMGEIVDFELTSEPWNTIELSDGTILKMRIAIKAVARLDIYDNITGLPMYIVNSENQIKTVNVKMELRKPPMPKTEEKRTNGQEVA